MICKNMCKVKKYGYRNGSDEIIYKRTVLFT